MKKLWWLLLLVGCGQHAAEHEAPAVAAATRTSVTRPATSASPSPTAVPLRSADAPLPATTYDTLHISGRVLTLSPTTKATFDRAYNTALPALLADTLDAPAITATGGRVWRVGSRLFFRPAAGPLLAVTDDTTDTPEASRYCYWGTAERVHQWVLAAGFWEGSGAVAVDQRTGHRTSIWGQPIASPDGRFFLTASADLEAGYNPNGIQLYAVTATGPQLLWQRQFSAWQPQQLRWRGKHTIIIQQLEGPTSSKRPPREGFAQLNLTFLLAQRPR